MKKLTAALLAILVLTSIITVPVAASVDKSEYPHYLDKNRSRYEAYHAQNPGLPYDIAIAYVNANVDKGYYNDIVTVDKPDSISVLVNKNYALPLGYVPKDLVDIGSGYLLREEAAEHLAEMIADMNSSGYRIYVMAAYRTYQTQASKHSNAINNYGNNYADTRFARAGHSEHQTGLAVDILHRRDVQFMADAMFQNSKEYAWLMENSYKYGFILRYPSEFEDIHGFIYEPWHWRYVGVSIATVFYNDGISMFEEYYGRFLAPGIFAEKKITHRMRFSWEES